MPRNEADTRAQLIDPAIHRRGWTEDLIRREETAGTIEIINGRARRRARGRMDYTLRVKVNLETQPVALALIEAKREDMPAGHGLDQAKGYAACKRLNIRFVFSTNGHQFVEYNSFTGQTSAPRPMEAFPTPDELRDSYEEYMGFSLESKAARPLLQAYPGGEGMRRYYQDAAIRAVMEKIAHSNIEGQPARALLSLATGAGKTFIAVNLLKRISDAGQMTRALFVCDRDELRSQALRAFQNVFGADAAEAYRLPDGTNNAQNARIHIATYQTLGIENEDGSDNFLSSHYEENYFSHVVIDECHRSAWGKWSQVLTRNIQAAQIGLTATPRRLTLNEKTDEAEQDEAITANNIIYFGEPVYEYSLTQAIEDGYLAACEIQKGRVNLDDTGITLDDIMARHPVNAITGQPMVREQVEAYYTSAQFEDKIVLPDRVMAMCQDLFNYLLESGGPEQKTIIFCVRDRHADDVVAQMNNLYAQWCQANGKPWVESYAFKCTAASSGNDQLPDLRGSARSHFIAATVDLLSTGVDVPCVRNIVFFKYVKSPISFYQMVGRGTRIDAPSNKLMFTVYDYTNATRLFGKEFITQRAQAHEGGTPPPPPPPPPLRVEGFDVVVSDAGRYILAEVDGKPTPVPIEEYKAQLAERLVGEVKTLRQFRECWVDPNARRGLILSLTAAGYSPNLVRTVSEREECDLYDVLAELGWGMNPRTRRDRALAFTYKQEEWINTLPRPTAAAVRAIAGQFERGGTDGLESPQIFNTPAVKAAGGLAALKLAGNPRDLLIETKTRMFAV